MGMAPKVKGARMTRDSKAASNGQVVDSTGFGDRLFRATLSYAARAGKMPSQTAIGILVGKELGQAPPHQTTVAAWFKGTAPALPVIAAIAKALGVDPGWLAFGPLTAANMLSPRSDDLLP